MFWTDLLVEFFTPHIVTVGDQKIRIKLPDEYSEIGEIVGVVKDNPTNPAHAFSGKVNALVSGGVLVRIYCRCKIGFQKYRYRTVLCAVPKVQSALEALVGKTLPSTSGGEAIIKTTGFKNHRRLA